MSQVDFDFGQSVEGLDKLVCRAAAVFTAPRLWGPRTYSVISEDINVRVSGRTCWSRTCSPDSPLNDRVVILKLSDQKLHLLLQVVHPVRKSDVLALELEMHRSTPLATSDTELIKKTNKTFPNKSIIFFHEDKLALTFRSWWVVSMGIFDSESWKFTTSPFVISVTERLTNPIFFLTWTEMIWIEKKEAKPDVKVQKFLHMLAVKSSFYYCYYSKK